MSPRLWRVLARVRVCAQVTYRLGGENYVFWGGREGYQSALNTNVRRELDHMGRFLQMAVEHKNVSASSGPPCPLPPAGCVLGPQQQCAWRPFMSSRR